MNVPVYRLMSAPQNELAGSALNSLVDDSHLDPIVEAARTMTDQSLLE